ncbi:ANTAR domain-containing protein [Streptomyces pseudogriseolus]|uniref:ANTAR domain-containing protein n=2 Tax=Streptomyces pseudogriseolus TaxID=36817 RepID=UPI003FA27066
MIDSHATVDRAVGVLIAVHGIAPTAGLEVLREVAQRTGTELHPIAETVIGCASGRPLPELVRRELNAAVQRHTPGDGPGQPAQGSPGFSRDLPAELLQRSRRWNGRRADPDPEPAPARVAAQRRDGHSAGQTHRSTRHAPFPAAGPSPWQGRPKAHGPGAHPAGRPDRPVGV